jgi:hypothetical protein
MGTVPHEKRGKNASKSRGICTGGKQKNAKIWQNIAV